MSDFLKQLLEEYFEDMLTKYKAEQYDTTIYHTYNSDKDDKHIQFIIVPLHSDKMPRCLFTFGVYYVCGFDTSKLICKLHYDVVVKKAIVRLVNSDWSDLSMNVQCFSNLNTIVSIYGSVCSNINMEVTE